jgi:hypothetical protein
MIDLAQSNQFHRQLLDACVEYRAQLDVLLAENERLKQELSEHWSCIEDICCGAGIECPKCGKQRPCCCNDLGEPK